MAKYRAFITTDGDKSKEVEAATPAALGIAIGQQIKADPRDDVEIVYHVSGPSSRRIAT